MLELFYLGLYFHFASSNYELDPSSNYNPNAAIEDCNWPESNQLSQKKCFCYSEPENDMEYSICKESGVVMFRARTNSSKPGYGTPTVEPVHDF